MTHEEIKEKAKQINDTSTDYHLSHAVFATNKITETFFKKHIAEKIKELEKQLIKAEQINDSKRIKEIKLELDRLDTPYRIYVEYFNDEKMDGGRAVYLPASNQLVIEIPEQMLADSKNKDGSYNPQGIRKLRWMTAHELGHIALQTNEILSILGREGTQLLSKGEKKKEEEADIFAKELLDLRHKRNRKLFTTKEWEMF